MNSEWFILKKNSHLGPFSKEDLFNMFDSNEIGESDRIWKEGWGKSKTYFEARDDRYSDQWEIPPLPTLPIEESTKKVESVTPEVSKSEDRKKRNRHRYSRKQSKVKFSLNNYKMIFKPEIKKPHQIIIAGAALLVVVFLFGTYQIKNPNVFGRPAHMSTLGYKVLKGTAIKKAPLMAKASLSSDKKILWFALNTPLEGDVIVSLKSRPGKTFGEATSVQAKGFLKERLLTITKFQFDKGTKLIDGIYDVQIISSEKMDLAWWGRFVGQKTQSFEYRNDLVISSYSEQVFYKQLEKLLKRKRQNSKRFWEELIQKYRTVMMITSQIKDGFQSIFESPFEEWQKKTNIFEMDYKTKYGIFFTEFVKANESSYNTIMKKNFENVTDVLSSYNHLSNLATQIGEHSMFALEKLQAFTGDEIVADEIKEVTIKNLDMIMEKCKAKVKLLTETF